MKKHLTIVLALVLSVALLTGSCKKKEKPQDEETAANKVTVKVNGEETVYKDYNIIHLMGYVNILTELKNDLRVHITFPETAQEGETYTDKNEFAVTGYDSSEEDVFDSYYSQNFSFTVIKNDAENKWYKGTFKFDYEDYWEDVTIHVEGSYDVKED